MSKISGFETTIFSFPPNDFTFDSKSPNDLATDNPPGLILQGPKSKSLFTFFCSFAYFNSE